MIRPDVDLATLLERQAYERGDRPFLTLVGERTLTYADVNREANRLAHGLSRLVGPGDPVAVMLPNSIEFVIVSYALKKLAAVEVAVNTEFRGPGLARMLGVSRARLLVAHPRYLEAIAPIAGDLPHLRTAIVAADGGSVPGLDSVRLADVLADREDDPARGPVRDTDLATVLFTSGTTGPAKGCMLSHRYALQMGHGLIDALRLTGDDCLFCPFPLYHADAAFLTVVPALMLGARAALAERFSASRFWDDVRESGATVFDFMGATLTMLWKQEPRPDDADNRVRVAWGVPMPSWRRQFEERFGLRLVHAYGLTDGGMVAYESLDVEEPVGSCGRAFPPYELAILGPDGAAVPPGTVGEICIRAAEPGVTMDGYLGMPEATAGVLRGGWLHTGDLGSLDAEGHLFFVSRQKDAIRRRGENISAWEIEDVVNGHPAVAESAAVGVPSALTEEDVKVFVVLREGTTLDAEELREYCRARMARFMVPEQVEVIAEIPKTPTGKPAKYLLTGASA